MKNMKDSKSKITKHSVKFCNEPNNLSFTMVFNGVYYIHYKIERQQVENKLQ